MYTFIFPTKDAWISSGSNHVTGVTEKDQNFGKDPILELRKDFWNQSFDFQTRILMHFDLSSISESIRTGGITNPTWSLSLFEAEGVTDLSTEYKIVAYPLSQSWDEGTGKFGNNPKTTDGVSWNNRNNKPGSTEVTWSTTPGTPAYGGAYISTSAAYGVQSFSYESPDISMNVTNLVNKWIDQTNTNYGFLLRFSGSQETNNITTGKLKFFSSDTHTIYQPRLNVSWDDHVIATGSATTGSLLELDVGGETDNYLYIKGLRDSYNDDERVRFKIGARKRYIQKTFSTSVYTTSGSFVPEASGSYSIVDAATGEVIVPFSDSTTLLSCNTSGSYFTQWLDGFPVNRIYKILLKVKYDDGQIKIFDDDFEFKVKK